LKWKEVIELSFPVQTLYLTVRNDDKRITGVFPACVLTEGNSRVLSSLPFSDFGGPVIDNRYQNQACALLYNTISEYCRNNKISLARLCFLRGGCERQFKSGPCYIEDGKGIVYLDLKSKPPDIVWNILESKERQKIRKLEKKGFEVREATSKSDLKTFLSLYYKNMQHLGVPGYRPNFFENVWNLLYPQNFTILFVEMKAALGGVGFFKYDKTIYLTYFGMDRESLQHTPAVAPFLFWKAINWAGENGFTAVSFGSTPTRPKSIGEKANLHQKMAFGSSFQPQEIIDIQFGLNSFSFVVVPKAILAWKSMRNMWPPRLLQAAENVASRFAMTKRFMNVTKATGEENGEDTDPEHTHDK
jgi:hypothetical protein